MITNINIGICHRRIQAEEPPYFVNWTENGENKYFFSNTRFIIENVKDKLQRIAKN